MGSTVSVTSIGYSTSGGKDDDKHLDITLALADDAGNPVGGAAVSIELSRNGSPIATGTAATAGAGTVTFSLKNAASGLYTTEVTNVNAAGLSFDGVTPANSFIKN